MLVQHVRQHRPDAVEAAAEIDRENALPPFRRDILKLVLFGDARVVDQQRHISELPLDAADHRVYRRGVGDVGLLRDDLSARGAQLRGQRLGPVLALDIVDAHGVARGAELACRRRADAAGRARDQSDLHTSPSRFFRSSSISVRARSASWAVGIVRTCSAGITSRISTYTSVRRSGKFFFT